MEYVGSYIWAFFSVKKVIYMRALNKHIDLTLSGWGLHIQCIAIACVYINNKARPS